MIIICGPSLRDMEKVFPITGRIRHINFSPRTNGNEPTSRASGRLSAQMRLCTNEEVSIRLVLRFVIRRAAQTVVVLWFVSAVIFFIINFTGDPISLLMSELSSEAEKEAMRQTLGLDKPILARYLSFLKGAIRGDLGTSYYHHQPALRLVLERVPASMELVAAALVIAVIVSIPVGILAAMYRGTWLDRGALVASLFGISAPAFWIAIMLILVFAVELRWFPSSGRGTLAHVVLPAFSLALYRIALFVRLVRSGMLDVLGYDYIRTARAKGLSEMAVVAKHAFRNILIPVVTLMGIQMGHLIAGAVVTERIFAWPGMGRLLLDAVYKLDYPVVIASVMVVAFIFAGINFLVDVSYAYLDPRVRYD